MKLSTLAKIRSPEEKSTEPVDLSQTRQTIPNKVAQGETSAPYFGEYNKDKFVISPFLDVMTMDGCQFRLPIDLGSHLTARQRPSKLVWINKAELRIIAAHHLYNVLPELAGSQRELLNRIALTYDLPALGAALGNIGGTRNDDRLGTARLAPSADASTWLKDGLAKMNWQSFYIEGRSPRGGIEVDVPKSLYIALSKIVDEIGGTVKLSTWLEGVQSSDIDVYRRIKDQIEELSCWAKNCHWQVEAKISVFKKDDATTSGQGMISALFAPVTQPQATGLDVFRTSAMYLYLRRAS